MDQHGEQVAQLLAVLHPYVEATLAHASRLQIGPVQGRSKCSAFDWERGPPRGILCTMHFLCAAYLYTMSRKYRFR